MVRLVNRAKMSTSTTGTGTITLGSAVDGYQSFAGAGVVDGDEVRYTIEDGPSWEIGNGTYTSSGTTLTRNVDESSDEGTAISLSGNAVVFVTAAGDDLQSAADMDQGVSTTDSPEFAGLTVDTDTLYVDSANNRVGIGTGSPSEALEVNGSVKATGDVETSSINGGPLAGFRNAIINGNFDIWQRGTSFSGAGFTADRWSVGIGGTGEVASTSQGGFALGQTDVPGNPQHYLRLDVSDGGTGTSAYVETRHRIEGVDTLAGETWTLTFWAKADAAKDVRIRIAQFFGTGGTPSATLDTDFDIVALTTAWQKFTVVIAVPSISGKTLGTDGNDFLQVSFLVSDGDDTIGIQTGVFDIAQVQLEPGSVATPFERRPIGTELALCQRYYFEISGSQSGAVGYKYIDTNRNNLFNASVSFPVTMRGGPSFSIGWDSFDNCEATSSHDVREDGATLRVSSTASGPYRAYGGTHIFDAEL